MKGMHSKWMRAAAVVLIVAIVAIAGSGVDATGSGVSDGSMTSAQMLSAEMSAAQAELFGELDQQFGDEEAALLETEVEVEADSELSAFGAPKNAVDPKKAKAVSKKKAAKTKATKSVKAKTSKAKTAKATKAKTTKAKTTKAAKTKAAKTTKAAKSTKATKEPKTKAAKSTKATKATKAKSTKATKATKTKDAKATKASKSTKAAKEPKTKDAKVAKETKAKAKDAKETAATPKRNGKGRTGGAKFGATFGATPFSGMTSAAFKKQFLNSWNHLTAGQKLRPRPSRKSSAKKKTTGDKAAAKSKIKKLAMRLLQVVQPPKKKPATGTTSSVGTAQPKLNGQNGPGLAVGTLLSQSTIARLRKEAATIVAPKSPKSRGLVDKDVDFSDWSPFVRTHSSCGACWSQVAADVIQAGLVRAKGKKSFTISGQYWMDCDVAGGNFRANLACDGGSVMNALQYSIKAGHGMMDTLKGGNGKWEAGVVYAETDYPWQYNSEGQHQCADSTKNAKRKYVLRDWSYAVKPTHSLILDSSAANRANLDKMNGKEYQAPGNPDLALGGKQGAIKSGDREMLLAKALNNFGPLAVIIDAAGLQRYTGGVATPAELGCSSDPEKGTHAMLLVGMQTADNGKKYWVLKNSWGRDWGEDGYLYLARGGDPCGITAAAVYANIAGDKADPIVGVAEKVAATATATAASPSAVKQAAEAAKKDSANPPSAADLAAFALSRGECDVNSWMGPPSAELKAKCEQNDRDLEAIKRRRDAEPQATILAVPAGPKSTEKLQEQGLKDAAKMKAAINKKKTTTKKTKKKKTIAAKKK